MRSYTRWTAVVDDQGHRTYTADWVGSAWSIDAVQESGAVELRAPDGHRHALDGDTARMIGVRLIEAAALADDGRSVQTRDAR